MCTAMEVEERSREQRKEGWRDGERNGERSEDKFSNCCGKIPSKIQMVFNASFLSYRPLYIPELTALESDEVSSARCLSDHL